MDRREEIRAAAYAALKRYWGYSSFMPHQEEVVMSLVHGRRDCVVIMATGSGKSLCFQLPALVFAELNQRATSIIISPLVSLMEDQVHA